MARWFLASLGLLLLAGCKPSGSGDTGGMKMNDSPSTMPSATAYTCTMHPEVVSNTPGKCPKCGMDLVAKK